MSFAAELESVSTRIGNLSRRVCQQSQLVARSSSVVRILLNGWVAMLLSKIRVEAIDPKKHYGTKSFCRIAGITEYELICKLVPKGLPDKRYGNQFVYSGHEVMDWLNEKKPVSKKLTG